MPYLQGWDVAVKTEDWGKFKRGDVTAGDRIKADLNDVALYEHFLTVGPEREGEFTVITLQTLLEVGIIGHVVLHSEAL